MYRHLVGFVLCVTLPSKHSCRMTHYLWGKTLSDALKLAVIKLHQHSHQRKPQRCCKSWGENETSCHDLLDDKQQGLISVHLDGCSLNKLQGLSLVLQITHLLSSGRITLSILLCFTLSLYGYVMYTQPALNFYAAWVVSPPTTDRWPGC